MALEILVGSLAENIVTLVSFLQYLSGAVFIFYIILVYLRWREAKILKKTVAEVEHHIKGMRSDLHKIVKRYEKR